MIFRAAIGLPLVAFVPGWIWTRALFPPLRLAETIVLSVTLSIAMLSVVLFLGSIAFGVPVTAVNAVWWAAFLIAAGSVFRWSRSGQRAQRRP